MEDRLGALTSARPAPVDQAAPDRLPPGPDLPSWLQAILISASPGYVHWLHRRYGDQITVRMGHFGTLVYLTDPDDIRTVFRGDPAVYHAGEANGSILEPVLGPSSVLVTDEDAHLRQRRLMTPMFHGAAVARLTATIGEIAAADVDRWPVGWAFPVIERMRRITFEVILRTVIGVEDTHRLAEFRRTLPAVADLDNLMILQFVFPQLRDRWPWRRFRPLAARADALLCSEIERARADPALTNGPMCWPCWSGPATRTGRP